MDYLVNLFGSIPLGTVIFFIAALIYLSKIYVKVRNHFYSDKDKEDNFNKFMQEVKDYKSYQLLDTQRHEELKFEIAELRKAQQEIIARQNAIDEANKQRALNTIREKLLQSYNYYTNEEHNPKFAWSALEKESFDALFKDYEDLGGNGYMHSVVQPAMSQLQIIPMYDTDKLAELMYSRR